MTATSDSWCEEQPTNRLVGSWRAVATAMTPIALAAWAARTSTVALELPVAQVVRHAAAQTVSRRRIALRQGQRLSGSSWNFETAIL